MRKEKGIANRRVRNREVATEWKWIKIQQEPRAREGEVQRVGIMGEGRGRIRIK